MSANARLPHRHFHAQVEQFRVPVLHLVLPQKGGHHLLARRLKGDAQRFVLDVRAETLCVHFYCRLQKKKKTDCFNNSNSL